MISFVSRADYVATSYGGYASPNEGYQMVIPAGCSVNPLAQRLSYRRRSSRDFILTSKETYFAGDRACSNRQIHATFSQKCKSVTGIPGTVPFTSARFEASLSHGLAWIPPSDGHSYSDAEIASGWKAYAWAPVCTRMTGEAPKLMCLVLPENATELRRVETSKGYSFLTINRFSAVHSGSRIISMVENFSLSRQKGESGWTSAGYSAVVHVLGAEGGTNMPFGLTITGVSPYSSFVPTALYPGGVLPSTATIVKMATGGTFDPFGFKALMISRCAFVPLPKAGSTLAVTYGKTEPSQAWFNINALISLMPEYADSCTEGGLTEFDWAECANTCIDGCRNIDINGIAYIVEAVKGVTDTLLAIRKGKLPDMSPADAWLSSRYGARLTVADTKSIVSAARQAVSEAAYKYSITRAHVSKTIPVPNGMLTQARVDLSYKLYYNRYDDPVVNVLRTIADWDLWPSTANIWDLIPFSFVVDWFVDIQGQLECIDNAQYEQFLTIRSILATDRWVYTFRKSAFDYGDWTCNEMTMVYYHRRHLPSLSYAPLRFGSGHASNINWIDGASLILQKASK